MVSPPAGRRSRSAWAFNRSKTASGRSSSPATTNRTPSGPRRDPAWPVCPPTSSATTERRYEYPGPDDGRPVSSAFAPIRSVIEKRTLASPASAIPMGSPPGAGKRSPRAWPIHRMRNSPRPLDSTTVQAGGTPFGRTAHSASDTWIACAPSPTPRMIANPAAASCRVPKACLARPETRPDAPYAMTAASANAAVIRYTGAFVRASGRYPAAESHARAVAETATDIARHDLPRLPRSAAAKQMTAAIGRNADANHDVGPSPGTSRRTFQGSSLPTNDASDGPGAPTISLTTGNARAAAVAVPRTVSTRPRSGRLAVTTCASAINPTASSTPGRKDTAIAPSNRSHTTGSAATPTRIAMRPSENDHRTAPDSTYAIAATIAVAGSDVCRANDRYARTPATAGNAPRRTFVATAVLPSDSHEVAPSAATAGDAGCVPPSTVVRTPDKSSWKKASADTGNTGNAPPPIVSGPSR